MIQSNIFSNKKTKKNLKNQRFTQFTHITEKYFDNKN